MAVNLDFLDPEQLLFHSSSSSVILMRVSGTPFQTHYFSENLVASGIEPGISINIRVIKLRRISGSREVR
jgi:hypothetical protein